MGNSKSKKVQKEPQKEKFFEREKRKAQLREEKRKKNLNPVNRRGGTIEPPVTPAVLAGSGPAPRPLSAPAHVVSYDDEAMERMRYQLHNDSNAFLLNNILLSVQFFENYEREVYQIKNNPISERENSMNEAMVRQNKHVFYADRLQECVHEHIAYQRSRGQMEPLMTPRLFVIYDNVEASEPGDTSDYSAVLDAPFYKLRIEDCKEAGYVKLRKMEVLESTLHKDNELNNTNKQDSDDSLYADSEKESDSDEVSYNANKGEELLKQIKSKIENTEQLLSTSNVKLSSDNQEVIGRRFSGPMKQVSLQVAKNSILNIDALRNSTVLLTEENESRDNNDNIIEKRVVHDDGPLPRKSILKNRTKLSAVSKDINTLTSADLRKFSSETNAADDTETTSGYRSNSSSRQNENSETESDYGYSTITESATPKRIELSSQSNYSPTSGVLPEESWTPVEIKAFDDWDDEDENEVDDEASKSSLSRNLYEKYYYLNSLSFMNNFVDNFIINLGSGLGLTPDAIRSALTQGPIIYCDSNKNGSRVGYEIFPALIAGWPNAANQWIIRERRIIQNPRTNFSYQWPTKYMVNKAIGFGCLLVPVGFRPKRGLNPEQTLQWKLIFPAAERYLESCLAHSHIRCYLFTLALHKTFMEIETAKLGIDASHIKNHLFWQCEDNYAKWPEDRLGESLRIFLNSLYIHFGQSRLPNYFVNSCNEFKSIPKPVLLKLQRRLAYILEAPVMHLLHAIDKLKYTKRDFYPTLNCLRLYEILTCKNPLRILNPNLPTMVPSYPESSDSDDDAHIDFWQKAKDRDKLYQWKTEKRRQMQERRRIQMNIKKQKSSSVAEKEINEKIILPNKMEAERRRLVLEFFIPHFIAMARSSERFEAIKQAIIYLEQAQRLSKLLLEEPGGDITANEYLDVIRDKLADCQRKLVQQGGYKLPPRRESVLDRSALKNMRRSRLRFEQVVGQGTSFENLGASAFTFVDVHMEGPANHEPVRLNDAGTGEESKL